MKGTDNIKFSYPGASQATRLNDLLLNPAFQISNLSEKDLINYAVDFSNFINYYNTKNEKKGNWSAFFKNDESVLMAEISRYDLKRFSNFGTLYLNQIEEEKEDAGQKSKMKLLTMLFRIIYQAVEDWYTKLLDLHGETYLLSIIRNTIKDRLAKNLQQLNVLTGSNEDKANKEPSTSAIAIWITEQDDAAHKLPEKEELVEKLRIVFYDLGDVIKHLKQIAETHYEKSLTEGNHLPVPAMLLAFVRAFKHQQNAINGITQRHLDHYYKKILNIQAPKPIADKTFITLKLTKGYEEYLLPAKTELLAGKDKAEKDIVFTTEMPVIVNNAKIAALKTLFVSYNPKVFNGPTGKHVKKIYSADINMAALNDAEKAWMPFGYDNVEVNNADVEQDYAPIGFAVAAPLFVLSEGKREIIVRLGFDSAGYQNLINMLNDVAAYYKFTYSDAFYKLLHNAFLISITTATGWMKINKYSVAEVRDTDETSTIYLELKLFIDDNMPAIAGYNSKLHAIGNFDYKVETPVIKFEINPSSSLYAYSYINNMALRKIELGVNAEGCHSITVSNQVGPVNIQKPYAPFGMQPEAGDYFIIGCKEICYKPLTYLGINIKWFNLPQYQLGFAEYYAGYPFQITNESFECDLGILDEGEWKKPTITANKPVLLFRSLNPNSPVDYRLNPITAIDYLHVEDLKLKQYHDNSADLLVYTIDSKRGFIKLSLTASKFGFGNKAYPIILADNLVKKSKKEPVIDVNKPFTPVIEEISINYSASSCVLFDNHSNTTDNCFFHIHPFGLEKVTASTLIKELTLLPAFDGEGNMFINLVDVNPNQTVTLLFLKSHHHVSLIHDVNESIVKWFYLDGNKWLPLPDNHFLSDSTKELTNEGIVTLTIPQGAFKTSTIMPGNGVWLRAEINKVSHDRILLRQIITNAVEVKRVIDDEPGVNNLTLASGTIKGFKNKTGEIASVNQPDFSTGGAVYNTPKEWYTYVHERLAHKNRAVNTWDYERLILQRFPSVNKVKCVPFVYTPGSPPVITIALLPALSPHRKNLFSPMYFEESLLEEVTEYIKGFASPFANIKVINPSYEYVKVQCLAGFVKGYGTGYYLNELINSLKKYLTPWMSAENDSIIDFAQPINLTNLVNFIERTAYVENVVDIGVSIVKTTPDGFELSTNYGADSNKLIHTTYPWSIMVSAANHTINIADYGQQMTPFGVETLEVNTDFIII